MDDSAFDNKFRYTVKLRWMSGPNTVKLRWMSGPNTVKLRWMSGPNTVKLRWMSGPNTVKLRWMSGPNTMDVWTIEHRIEIERPSERGSEAMRTAAMPTRGVGGTTTGARQEPPLRISVSSQLFTLNCSVQLSTNHATKLCGLWLQQPWEN
ncbi:hypothetical protein J6590_058850 [Homalodisca vitripennis]|nr:hypothetical protein J6590_058850 [Homalodisca vitripennis]